MDSLTSQILKPRSEAVAIARSWLRTPYVLGGRVKGAGCDCGTLLAEYLIEIGAVSRADLEDLGFYSSDWFAHADSERYLLRLMRYANKVAETVCRPGRKPAQPGDLVLFRVVGSKRFNHGAIITAWPRGVHAFQTGVIESDLSSHPLTAFRDMDIFSPFGADHAGL